MLFASQIADIKRILPWNIRKKEKSALRALIEQKRRIYPKEQVESDSALVVEQIEHMSWFKEAKAVMLYYPIHNEVDLRPLINRYKGEKIFLLPVTHRNYIEVRRYEGEELMMRGRHKVPEPQTEPYNGKIDLILVPGVVFDNKCNRIGRGGGYYDRFLKKQRAHQVGVCYDFQLKKHEIPHTIFDHPVDRVVTPTRTIGE